MNFFIKEQLLQNIEVSKKRGKAKAINILCCINDFYVNQLVTLMTSIRHFCNKKITLYVLSTSLSKQSENEINRHMKYLNITPWVRVVELPRLNYTQGDSWSIDVYLRVLAFDLLPKNVNKILYIDGDVLATKDISEIYNNNINNKLLGCCYDVYSLKYPFIQCRREHNIYHDYFNAGVLLMNLQEQRAWWTVEEMLYNIQTHNFGFNDQDLLNMMCLESDLKFMPFRYNFHAWWELKTEFDFNLISPVLIHFVSPEKPWGKNGNPFTTQIYHDCVKISELKNFCK